MLGKLYKSMCHCSDEYAVVDSTRPEEMEELLTFARAIASPGDEPMHQLINGFRGYLENQVHTAAGR